MCIYNIRYAYIVEYMTLCSGKRIQKIFRHYTAGNRNEFVIHFNSQHNYYYYYY